MAKSVAKATSETLNDDPNFVDPSRTAPLAPVIKEGDGGEGGDGDDGDGEIQPQPEPPAPVEPIKTQAELRTDRIASLDEYMAGNRHIGERVRAWHPFAPDSDVGADNARADYDRLMREEEAKKDSVAVMKTSG